MSSKQHCSPDPVWGTRRRCPGKRKTARGVEDVRIESKIARFLHGLQLEPRWLPGTHTGTSSFSQVFSHTTKQHNFMRHEWRFWGRDTQLGSTKLTIAHWPYSSCLCAMSRNALCFGLAFGCTNRPLRRHVEEVVTKTPTIEQKPVNQAQIELRAPEPTALSCPERLCRVGLWDLGDYNLGVMTSDYHHETIVSHWAHAVVNGRACRSSPCGERS